MMKQAIGVLLLFALIISSHAEGTRYSLPGKPTLTRCRSPEKETFTCWWEPGSDGGLPTTYALYYRKENSDTVYECPDYQTAGENSCFFNKNSTSIWVNYNITVVATNELGSAFSDPVDIDVVYIVKPNPPERLSVVVMEDRSTPFLRVSWEPPHKADTRSGWITLIYEIRVKFEGGNEWEMHLAGQQKMFNIFSLRSGAKYLVQVRCKPDHGFWSEWSPPSHINVPEYFHQEKSMWILIIVFSTFILLILTWLLHMNSKSLKHCILPPVPGPKIKGFDKQLLKNGMSEEILNALMVSDFPPAASSNYEDLLVEYLEVYIPKEQEQLESKDLHDVCLKSEGSTSDSDSGRGSCDSRTLLTDRCGEAKGVKNETDWERIETEAQQQQVDWNEEALACAQENMDSPDISNGRVKTWPSVFSPLPQDSTHPLDHQSPLIMAKQHHPSDSLFAPGSAPSYITHPDHSTSETMRPGYCAFTPPSKQPHLLHPQTQACRQLQSHSDINISSIVCKQPPVTLPPPAENVEVQRVTKDNTVFLQPVKSGSVEGCPQKQRGEDYSKVKGVDRGNVLLLQTDEMEQDRNEQLETNGAKGDCTSSTVTPAKKWCNEPAIRDGRVLATNGYVDTATFCTVPT